MPKDTPTTRARAILARYHEDRKRMRRLRRDLRMLRLGFGGQILTLDTPPSPVTEAYQRYHRRVTGVGQLPPSRTRMCRVCRCTDNDCRGCIARTGAPCHWVDARRTLCSACAHDCRQIPLGAEGALPRLCSAESQGVTHGIRCVHFREPRR